MSMLEVPFGERQLPTFCCGRSCCFAGPVILGLASERNCRSHNGHFRWLRSIRPGRHIKRVAYNSGECLLVAIGGDLGIPWWAAVPLFLFLLRRGRLRLALIYRNSSTQSHDGRIDLLPPVEVLVSSVAETGGPRLRKTASKPVQPLLF